ncbi:hypothetical protein [Legionella fallonii]|uniref:Uncharacterized protein n=1 Tax=Legionella fallonii LLAP-10 TaxID=1212491 RepID=A0A098G4U3_9GAMM|nr:hypothetical protein [Legionella fallonii]CEG56986.1 conserved protein of unknown function [Legionella fallonii LLAP-10]
MVDFKIGEQVWIINFEVEDDFYLLSKQTITDLLEEQVECEDEFNTFHVSYEDVYRSKSEALNVMISKLQELSAECEAIG